MGMRIRYKCPWTGKTILEIDFPNYGPPIYETPCPDCGESHPLPICPREYVNSQNSGENTNGKNA